MPIYNGNKKIDSLYFNGKKIASAFVGDKQVYSSGVRYECHITNLGAENPNDVVFTKSANFPTESQAYEEVVVDGNYFAKFTPWYKKVVADENNNVREMHIANYKKDDSYHIYDCFVDEDGNELPYILIGQYNMSSTITANSINSQYVTMYLRNARSLARAKGTGYQVLDLIMYIFWRDLALACNENINFCNGQNLKTNYLGLKNIGESWFSVDGISNYDKVKYIYSKKPSKYINLPYEVSDGYITLSYGVPAGWEKTITELGYDENNPTINLPKELSGSTDNSKYYCDVMWRIENANYPLTTTFESDNSASGLFTTNFVNNWDVLRGYRLCYRPVGGN